MSSTESLQARHQAWRLRRALGQAVRREVEKSPELYDRWRRCRRRTLFVRAFEIAAVVVAAPTLLVSGAVMLPMMATLFLGPLEGKTLSVASMANPPRVALALQGLSLCGALLLTTGLVDRSTCLASYSEAHYPIPDRKPNRLRPANWLLVGLVSWTLIAFVAVPYGMILLQRESLAQHLTSAAILVVLQFCLLLASGVLAVAFNPTSLFVRGNLVGIGLFVALGALLLGMGMQLFPAHAATYVTPFLYLLPTGWVGAVLVHAVLEGQVVGWLLLVPVAAVLVAGAATALAFWRSEYVLGDFIKRPGRTSVVTLRAGFRVPKHLVRSPACEDAPRSARKDPREVHRSVEELLSGDARFLTEQPSNRMGFIERRAARMLSQRERTVLEIWSSRFTNSTRQWWWTWIALGVAVSVIAAGQLVRDGQKTHHLALLGSSTISLIAILGILALVLPQVGYGPDVRFRAGAYAARLLGLLPIALGEVFRGLIKLELVRAIFWLPALVLYGVVASWLCGRTIVEGVVFGAALQLLTFVSLPVGACSQVAVGADHWAARAWQWTWFGLYGVLIIPIVVISPALDVLGLVSSNSVTLAAGGVYLVVALVMARLFLAILNRGHLDLVRQRHN